MRRCRARHCFTTVSASPRNVLEEIGETLHFTDRCRQASPTSYSSRLCSRARDGSVLAYVPPGRRSPVSQRYRESNGFSEPPTLPHPPQTFRPPETTYCNSHPNATGSSAAVREGSGMGTTSAAERRPPSSTGLLMRPHSLLPGSYSRPVQAKRPTTPWHTIWRAWLVSFRIPVVKLS